MKSIHLNDTEYICHLIFHTLELPVYFLDKEKNIIHEFVCNEISSPFYSSKKELLNNLYQDDDPYNFPIIRTNNYLESFILIHKVNKKIMKGTFIIGPVLYLESLEGIVNGILTNTKSIIDKKRIMNYYFSLPAKKKSTLIYSSMLLYFLIYSKKIEMDVIEETNIGINKTIEKVGNPDLFISIRHQNNHECTDYSLAIRIFDAIMDGNKEKLLTYLHSYPNEETGTLCFNNELRNRKNQGIVSIAVATQYAIHGGLPSNISFSLSDLYIQNIEKLNDITLVDNLIVESLCTFADYVKKYGNQELSKTVLDCKNYILKNVYQELSLKQLANITNKNPMYLSTLFKKEVGMSLKKYIQQKKIEEAKKLLTSSNFSIIDISTLLNFYNQSYFTRVFKEHTGETPKQYQNHFTKC